MINKNNNKLKLDFDYEKNVQGLPKMDVMSVNSEHKFRFERFIEAMRERDGKILEVGCGGGAFIYNVLNYYPQLKVYATDFSCSAVYEAKNSIGNRIHWSVADGLAQPFKNECFDTVALMDVVEHVPDIDILFKESQRILKKDGLLHAKVPCERNHFTIYWLLWKIKIGSELTNKYGGHIQRLTTAELIKSLEMAGFKVKAIYYSGHPIGQLLAFFGFCLPKEILTRIFGASVSNQVTDYAISQKTDVNQKGMLLKILKIIRKLWNFIITRIAAISYYESTLFKRIGFMAVDVHITCVKRGETVHE